jgi:hypothetical protein
MQKRGQMTVFIGIGIVLVVLVSLGIYFGSDIGEAVGLGSTLSYPSEVAEVVEHIQECTVDSAESVVSLIGLSGGYLNMPEYFLVMESTTLPYFNYEGEDLTISKETLQSEMETYISLLMEQCVNFDLFSGLDITGEIEEVEVVVEEDEVSVVVSHPFEVSADESSYTVQEEYDILIASDLGFLRDVAEKIVDLSLDNPEEIDSTGILEFGVSDVTVAPYNGDSLVYILEHYGEGEEESEVFMFAEYYPELGFAAECEEDYDCDEEYICSEEECVLEEESESGEV